VPNPYTRAALSNPLITRQGHIEVIAGCMFSGKTEELIRRVRRTGYAKQPAAVFKHACDKRYDPNNVVSHERNSISSIPVEKAGDILLRSHDALVVGIDEAQFFGMDLVEVCAKLAGGGKRVIIAGLDLDWEGKPFGPMPNLMAEAEYVDKVYAVCVRCGAIASRSQRIVDSKEQVLVGEKSAYEARCRSCWEPRPVFAGKEDRLEMEG